MDYKETKQLIYFLRRAGIVALLALTLILIIWFFYRYGSAIIYVISPFVISLFMAYLLSPLVSIIEKRGISRTVAIILIYVMFSLIVYLAWMVLFPSFLEELQELVDDLPEYASHVKELLEKINDGYRRFNIPAGIREIIDENIEHIQGHLAERLEGLYASIINVFSSILLMLLVPVLTFIILKDEKIIARDILKVVPVGWRPLIRNIAGDIDRAFGDYFRGMVVISLAVGLFVYLGLLWLGVEFALFFGLLNTITNFIPFIGPFIGAIPVVLIALLDSPSLALKTALLIFVIQQVESNLVAPLIYGRTIKFHPLVIILLLLLGGKLFGLIGLLLVLPMAMVGRIIIRRLSLR